MSRQDYKKHAARYRKRLKRNPSLTVAAFCSNEGLNYSTARKYIKAPTAEKRKELQAELARKTGESRARLAVRSQTVTKKRGRTQKEQEWIEKLTVYVTKATINPAYTIKEFAEESGLKAATVRRQLQVMRRDSQFRSLFDLYDDQKKKFKGIKSRSRANCSESAEGCESGGESPKAPVSEKDQDGGGSETERDHAPESAPKSPDKAAMDAIESGYISHRQARARKTTALLAAHDRAINRGNTKHGGYCGAHKLVAHALDSLTEVDPLSVSDELITARARYSKMMEVFSDEMERIEQLRKAGEDTITVNGEERDLEAYYLSFALGGYEGRFSTLEHSIANMVSLENKRQMDHRKQLIEEMKMPHFLPAEATAIVIEVMNLRDRYGWDAITTAQNIERLGAKVPPALMLEVKEELASIEPEVEESSLSPEEFEKRAANYFNGREKEVAEQKRQRRKEMDEIYDELDPDGALSFDDSKGGNQ